MTNDWINVFTSADVIKCEIVKQVLIDNSIDAVVLNKQDYSYHFGSAEVYVQPANEAEAREIISKGEL